MVKNGCGQSSYKNLKLNVSQEWIVGINWFFATNLGKAKSCFSGLRVGVAFMIIRPLNLLYL